MFAPPDRSTKARKQGDFAAILTTEARAIVERLTLLPMPREPPSVDSLFLLMSDRNISTLIILDQKVSGIEQSAQRKNYGYEQKRGDRTLVVMDHHVNDPEFSLISTGNLSLSYFAEHPSGPPANAEICITHGDCDSILSALMMLRAIPPLPEFREAVMCADHTFKANPLADLLQAIEVIPRTGETVRRYQAEGSQAQLTELSLSAPVFYRSLETSVRNLGLILQGQDLDPQVQKRMQQRVSAREKWKKSIEAGEITSLPNGTCYCVINGSLSSDPCPEFLQALLPEASLILVFHSPPGSPDFRQLRVVLGKAAAPCLAVDDPALIPQFLVPGFAGRRDAGSNRRGGISLSDKPDAVAQAIDSNIARIKRTHSC